MTQNEIKQIKGFLAMIQGRLAYAFDESDNENYKPFDTLYQNNFTLSYMGKKCDIPFDATNYHLIEILLQDVLKEWE